MAMITTTLLETELPKNPRELFYKLRKPTPGFEGLLHDLCEKFAVIHVADRTTAFLTVGSSQTIILHFDFDVSPDVAAEQSSGEVVYELRNDPDHEAYFDMARIIVKCFGAGFGFLPFPKLVYQR